jgi:uncharacterized repeat protein (TIGR03806 family)
LQGRYLYSDFGSGTIWALTLNGTSVISNDIIATTTSPTSFGEDNQGEVYIVSRNNGIFGLDETSGTGNLPTRLSDTGVFADIGNLTVASGFIEYNVNHPFWSDGAIKRRWLGVPDPEQVQFTATGQWIFPTGTVIVKHFEIELTEGDPASRRRLETRLLLNTDAGWQGFTYRWNQEQSDATLLTSRETETLTIAAAAGGTFELVYEYPSRTDCLQCHTDVAGFVLGTRTRQLNRDFTYPGMVDNQLRSINHIGLFTTDIGDSSQYAAFPQQDDTSVTTRERARAYLDVNCAHCHQPGGPSPVNLDLRFDTPDNDMDAIGISPTAGDLGISAAELITPGEKQRSVLWQRLRSLDGNHMPPLGNHRVDENAVQIIGQWIDEL